MSDNREWWPEGYDLPAFRLKRQSAGTMDGGDWVRGSSVVTLEHTALRYRSQDPGIFDVVGKAILLAQPGAAPPDIVIDDYYHTVEILWSWPSHIDETWLEVALVRSSFGSPSTPQDGMTVFRALRSEFEREVEDETVMVPPPIVFDQPLPSKRWYYYTLFFRMNQVDWVAGMSDACLLPNDWGHRHHLWDAVPPYYQWIDDNFRVDDGFLRQFLNVFGLAYDNTRGFVEQVLELYHVDFTAMPLLKGLGANFNVPYEAGLGEIRYRGLVANVPNAQYVRGTAKGLKLLCEAASKYQCDVTGGQNMALYPDDSEFYRSTGNWGGAHPDALTAITALDGTLSSVAWNDVAVARVERQGAAGRGVMRVYTPKANETGNLLVICGDSRIRGDNPLQKISTGYDDFPADDFPLNYRDAVPATTGVPVVPGRPYGYSVWVAAEADCSVVPMLIWIKADGAPDSVLLLSQADPLGTQGTAWKEFQVQGYAPMTPTEGRFVVPAIYFFSRTAGGHANRSPAIDISGGMLYQLGGGSVAVLPPDRYLMMGDIEKIGAPGPEAPAGFKAEVIGAPKERG